MHNNPRIIKKYANRRLYDTELSRYITLEEIRQFVLDNINFRVIEAQTGADITKSTLLLIISSQEEGAEPVFSLEVLQHLIRCYSDNAQNMLASYLEQSMSFFIQQKENFEHQQPNAENPFSDWTQAPYAWMQEFFKMQKQIWQPNESSTKDKTHHKTKKKYYKNSP